MKNSSSCAAATVCLLLAAIVLAGCDDGRVPLAPVSGTVTYKGKPLHTGTVTFIPDPTGPYASGEINSDGTYTLMTYEDGDGAPVGNHRVMIVAHEPASGLPEDPNTDAMLLIPEKYGSDRKSGLTASVGDQDENVIDFDLE